jgi:hypothetical protein
MLVENAMRLRKVTKVVAQNIVAAGSVCKQLGVAARSKDRIGQAKLFHTHDWLQIILKYERARFSIPIDRPSDLCTLSRPDRI